MHDEKLTQARIAHDKALKRATQAKDLDRRNDLMKEADRLLEEYKREEERWASERRLNDQY